MKPDERFRKQPKAFWALVKLVTEELGYTEKKKAGAKEHRIRRYGAGEVTQCLRGRELNDVAVHELGWDELLAVYSEYRADLLENVVRPNLMKRDEAANEYEALRKRQATWRCPHKRNIQSGDKDHPKYLACMVNMIVELELGTERTHDCDPGGLITITKNKLPLRTLARRVDGAYPGINDPYAIWEVKEFYDNTTFGSRVADGIYESMLDGTELVELRTAEDVDVRHYLMMDDWHTWWELGRSYLCRAIDMLHDDLLDELFFGRQVLTEWPETVRSWPKDRITR